MTTAYITAENSTEVPLRDPVSDPRLRVTVVFTTPDATLAALRAVGRLAKSLHARIALVAAEVVPFQLALGLPLVPSDFREQRLLALVAESGVDVDEVSIEIFLCRDRRQCLRQVLRLQSPIVIGGKRCWWSRERKLAHWLGLIGRQVVFVDVSARETERANESPSTIELM